MKTQGVNRYTAARDFTGEVVQGAALGESVQLVSAVTTTGWVAVDVPDDAAGAVVWFVATGAATTIAAIYGGAHRSGAPASGLPVPTSTVLNISCIGADALWFKASGASCDVCICWQRSQL